MGRIQNDPKNIREHNATIKERQELLSLAGFHAVNAARPASLPLTYIEETTIVREKYGEQTIQGNVSPRRYLVPKLGFVYKIEKWYLVRHSNG